MRARDLWNNQINKEKGFAKEVVGRQESIFVITKVDFT